MAGVNEAQSMGGVQVSTWPGLKDLGTSDERDNASPLRLCPDSLQHTAGWSTQTNSQTYMHDNVGARPAK